MAREAHLMTDETTHYSAFTLRFGGHKTVNHRSGEYVKLTDRTAHANTIEGYFSIFKRGMRASISIVPRSTCTAISRSSTSCIRITPPTALMIASAGKWRWRASAASHSPIGGLTSDPPPRHADHQYELPQIRNGRSQLDKFKEASRQLETDDDPERFRVRVGKPVKHKPVENPT